MMQAQEGCDRQRILLHGAQSVTNRLLRNFALPGDTSHVIIHFNSGSRPFTCARRRQSGQEIKNSKGCMCLLSKTLLISTFSADFQIAEQQSQEIAPLRARSGSRPNMQPGLWCLSPAAASCVLPNLSILYLTLMRDSFLCREANNSSGARLDELTQLGKHLWLPLGFLGASHRKQALLPQANWYPGTGHCHQHRAPKHGQPIVPLPEVQPSGKWTTFEVLELLQAYITL